MLWMTGGGWRSRMRRDCSTMRLLAEGQRTSRCSRSVPLAPHCLFAGLSDSNRTRQQQGRRSASRNDSPRQDRNRTLARKGSILRLHAATREQEALRGLPKEQKGRARAKLRQMWLQMMDFVISWENKGSLNKGRGCRPLLGLAVYPVRRVAVLAHRVQQPGIGRPMVTWVHQEAS